MDDFTKSLRAEITENFQKYQENIPNFQAEILPVFQKVDKCQTLLSEITRIQQQKEEKCENSCMNCEPQLLGDLLGIKIVKMEEKLIQNLPAEVQRQETVASNSNEQPAAEEQEKEKEVKIVPQISDAEFKTIPKYQLGRLTLENLNDIVGKMDEFLTKKNQILSKSNKQLTRIDRELLDNWRELEMKSKKRLPTTLFFMESDIRPLLQERLRPAFAKAIPCLRHIRRIREERCGPLTFYFP